MENDQESVDTDPLAENDGEHAYQTLVDWVKSVPRAIQEIEENGTEEDLLRDKQQIKLVGEKLKELLLDHPLLTKAIIFPFSLSITLGIFSIIIEIVLPVLFSVATTYWIYHAFVGNSLRDKMREPFSYIQTKYYSM